MRVSTRIFAKKNISILSSLFVLGKTLTLRLQQGRKLTIARNLQLEGTYVKACSVIQT